MLPYPQPAGLLSRLLLATVGLLSLTSVDATPVRQCALSDLSVDGTTSDACVGVLSKNKQAGIPATDKPRYLNLLFGGNDWRDQIGDRMAGNTDLLDGAGWSLLSKIAADGLEGADLGYQFCDNTGLACDPAFPAGNNEQTAGQVSIDWTLDAFNGVSNILVALKPGNQWAVYHLTYGPDLGTLTWDVRGWSRNALSHLSVYGRFGDAPLELPVTPAQDPSVPEPAPLALLLLGVAGLSLQQRRTRQG